MMSGDELSSADEADEEDEEDDQARDGAASRQEPCVCCDLATSEVVRAMDAVADRLSGERATRITNMQLAIYQKRMAPLRAEGRPVRELTRDMLLRHYRTHRVSIMRTVAEEIRVFELMGRTLRRTGLCDMDADGRKVLLRSGAQEYNKLAKSKLDLLKFYTQLEKQRREEEANMGAPK